MQRRPFASHSNLSCVLRRVSRRSSIRACGTELLVETATYGSKSSVPKQWGRWKLRASTGDHEAQWGWEVSSPHL